MQLCRCGPRANAIAERWIGTVRSELLDRMLILNQRQVEAVPAEYVAHFNTHRPHRTLNQAVPLQPLPPPASPSQLRVRRRDRLGGTDPRIFPGRITWMTNSASTGQRPRLDDGRRGPSHGCRGVEADRRGHARMSLVCRARIIIQLVWGSIPCGSRTYLRAAP
jgi:hypothetical protein